MYCVSQSATVSRSLAASLFPSVVFASSLLGSSLTSVVVASPFLTSAVFASPVFASSGIRSMSMVQLELDASLCKIGFWKMKRNFIYKLLFTSPKYRKNKFEHVWLENRNALKFSPRWWTPMLRSAWPIRWAPGCGSWGWALEELLRWTIFLTENRCRSSPSRCRKRCPWREAWRWCSRFGDEPEEKKNCLNI